MDTKEKRKYYKQQRNNQMTTELLSCLLNGKTVGQACNITMDIFPRDNLFIDVANGYIEVFD